jgi:hypothetical protein
LNGLDLADDIEETSPHEIDVLVGSDFYWDLITGQIRRGSTGPVAIHTRIGWAEDKFVFSLNEISELAQKLPPTKRNVVRLIRKFYDPLGFLSYHSLSRSTRSSCKHCSKPRWNAILCSPGKLLVQSNNFTLSLTNTPPIQIPRCYLDGIWENILSYTLCGHCDASLSAYAAVSIYRLRQTLPVHTKFVAAKTRVSPIEEAIDSETRALICFTFIKTDDCRDWRFGRGDTNIRKTVLYWFKSRTILDPRHWKVFEAICPESSGWNWYPYLRWKSNGISAKMLKNTAVCIISFFSKETTH